MELLHRHLFRGWAFWTVIISPSFCLRVKIRGSIIVLVHPRHPQCNDQSANRPTGRLHCDSWLTITSAARWWLSCCVSSDLTSTTAPLTSHRTSFFSLDHGHVLNLYWEDGFWCHSSSGTLQEIKEWIKEKNFIYISRSVIPLYILWRI